VQRVNIHRISIIINHDHGISANGNEVLMRNREFPSVGKADYKRLSIFVQPFAELLDVHALSLPLNPAFVKLRILLEMFSRKK